MHVSGYLLVVGFASLLVLWAVIFMGTSKRRRIRRGGDLLSSLFRFKRVRTPPNKSRSVTSSGLDDARNGPVIIGVGAVEPGVGATYHVVMLASYLSMHKRKVGVIEYNSKPTLGLLSEQKGQPLFDIGKIKVQTILPNERGINYSEFDDCHYILVDLGVLKPFDAQKGVYVFAEQYYEMTRTQCQILIGSAAPWRIGKSVFFNYNQDNIQLWKLVLTGGAGEWQSGYQRMLEPYFNAHNIHYSSFCDNPMIPSEKHEVLFEKVLGRFAPSFKSAKVSAFGRKQ